MINFVYLAAGVALFFCNRVHHRGINTEKNTTQQLTMPKASASTIVFLYDMDL